VVDVEIRKRSARVQTKRIPDRGFLDVRWWDGISHQE
jgi:hypothetical protein